MEPSAIKVNEFGQGNLNAEHRLNQSWNSALKLSLEMLSQSIIDVLQTKSEIDRRTAERWFKGENSRWSYADCANFLDGLPDDGNVVLNSLKNRPVDEVLKQLRQMSELLNSSGQGHQRSMIFMKPEMDLREQSSRPNR